MRLNLALKWGLNHLRVKIKVYFWINSDLIVNLKVISEVE